MGPGCQFFRLASPRPGKGGAAAFRNGDIHCQTAPGPLPGYAERPVNGVQCVINAVKAFGQYLSKMNIAASKNVPATKAKGIIDRICNTEGLSQKSRNLLIAADKLIRKGNTDVIRKVIAIGAILEDDGALFALTQDEVDAVISGAIEKLVEEQKKLTGKPYVFIGLAK